MSIVQKLTEGIVNRNMQQEGAALLNKWSQTGLLEGLDDNQKQNMAVLLENQAKSILKESTAMGDGAGSVEGFAAVAFPIVRRVFAGLIANDLVSVQPMSLPSGLIFFLDFLVDRDRLGYVDGESIYGQGKVASGIVDGVSLSQDNAEKGPNALNNGYSSHTASINIATTVVASGSVQDGGVASVDGGNDAYNLASLLRFDADIPSGSTFACATVPLATFTAANFDEDNFVAIKMTSLSNASEVRRLTRIDPTDSTKVLMTVVSYEGTRTATELSSSIDAVAACTAPIKDSFTTTGLAAGAIAGNVFGLEDNINIPELDIKVDSIAITAQTKKLKAKWTPELGQDLNAYHNIDAEVELTSILSEQIALEIDREILEDLVKGATAAKLYWSRAPGQFLNRTTGAAITPGDFTGTVSEWYETLVETINDVSAQIHRKTLRGGATHIVCSPEVANILEFTAGFRANVTADADKGDIGAVKVGSLNRKFDVIVDPYFPRNAILVARIGSSFLESGYVYAPYVPLQTTPTIFDPESFTPRKGVMTRYAKKMVRPDMYGLVIVRDL